MNDHLEHTSTDDQWQISEAHIVANMLPGLP